MPNEESSELIQVYSAAKDFLGMIEEKEKARVKKVQPPLTITKEVVLIATFNSSDSPEYSPASPHIDSAGYPEYHCR